MLYVIIIFGTLTLLAGLIIIFDPDCVFGFLKKHIAKLSMHLAAIVIRLLLGVCIILLADSSKYPLTMEIIGWISIGAAIILAVIGRNNFNRIMSWALSLPKPVGRIGGLFAVGFGAFLIYAFL
jgi:hypothetical protein